MTNLWSMIGFRESIMTETQNEIEENLDDYFPVCEESIRTACENVGYNYHDLTSGEIKIIMHRLGC